MEPQNIKPQPDFQSPPPEVPQEPAPSTTPTSAQPSVYPQPQVFTSPQQVLAPSNVGTEQPQPSPTTGGAHPLYQGGNPAVIPAVDTSAPDKKQRINRETYLASVVINNIFVPILFYFVVIGAIIGGTAAHLGGGIGLAGVVALIALLLYWLLTFLRACVYRCFDIGISQLWVLPLLIPLLNIPVFLYLCFKGSQMTPNKHGNMPQGLQLKRTLPFIPQ